MDSEWLRTVQKANVECHFTATDNLGKTNKVTRMIKGTRVKELTYEEMGKLWLSVAGVGRSNEFFMVDGFPHTFLHKLYTYNVTFSILLDGDHGMDKKIAANANSDLEYGVKQWCTENDRHEIIRFAVSIVRTGKLEQPVTATEKEEGKEEDKGISGDDTADGVSAAAKTENNNNTASRSKTKNKASRPLVGDDDRLQLESVKLNIDKFEHYLLHIEDMGRDNIDKVVRQVKKLMSNKGIKYAPWGEGVKFCPRIEHMGENFHQLRQEAVEFENEHGKDSGNGWLLTHPIRKLELYQDYYFRKCHNKVQGTAAPVQTPNGNNTDSGGNKTAVGAENNDTAGDVIAAGGTDTETEEPGAAAVQTPKKNNGTAITANGGHVTPPYISVASSNKSPPKQKASKKRKTVQITVEDKEAIHKEAIHNKLRKLRKLVDSATKIIDDMEESKGFVGLALSNTNI